MAQKSSGLFTKQTWLIIIGLIVAVIAGGSLLALSGDKSLKLLPRLSARQTTTLKIVADGQKNIVDRDLRKLNSELNITLTSDNAAIQSQLKGAGLSEIRPEIKAIEADTETFKALENAKINGRYDTAYKTAAIKKLTSLRDLLREVHEKTKNKALRQTLATEYEHISTHLRELKTL